MSVQKNVASARKSWVEAMKAAKPHQVTTAPLSVGGVRKGEKLLIPSPQMLDEFIRAIPPGESRDVAGLRKALAARFGAEATCPIATGVQLRTVAEAAYESLGAGQKLDEITPFWRIIDETTPVSQRLACGADFIARRRAQEGVKPAANDDDSDEARLARYNSRGLWA
ncbi:MAG: hypothetical protein ABWZ80_06040 [Beijerinckiaceae bacterium]